jgi:hypothetical protein
MVKNKKKTKVVLSLAEFNQDANAGVEPELAALPSAPKGAEEWDEAGGRPVYNSRGFRERTTTAFERDDGMVDDEEFLQRDWTRSGPLDDPSAAPGGGEGGERNWDGMRRGPLDQAGGDGAEEGADRDWTGMRRGPLDAADGAGGDGVERSWDGIRRQAVDAAGGPGAEKEVDFSAVRRGPVESEFAQDGPDMDFSTRRGPIEAEFEGGAREVDFSLRRGPVEADIGGGTGSPEKDFSAARRANNMVEVLEISPGTERDFGNARKGAAVVEAEHPADRLQPAERDFSDVRRGQAQPATAPEHHGPADTVDWNVRKGPLEAAAPSSDRDGGRVRDFKNMRQVTRPDSAEEIEKPATELINDVNSVQVTGDSTFNGKAPSEPRRREMTRTGSRGELTVKATTAIQDESTGKEIDWGRARRAQPLPTSDRTHRGGAAREGISRNFGQEHNQKHIVGRNSSDAANVTTGETETSGVTTAVEGLSVNNGTRSPAPACDDGDWTTVRAGANGSRRVMRGGDTVRGGAAPYRRGGGWRERGSARLVPVAATETADGPANRGSPQGPVSTRPDAADSRAALLASSNGNVE